MKKLIEFILASFMVITLASCGNDNNNDKTNSVSSNNDHSSSQVTNNEEADISTSPVKVYSLDETKGMLEEIQLTPDNFMEYFEWKGEYTYEFEDGMSGKTNIRTDKYMSIKDGYVSMSMFEQGISPEVYYDTKFSYKSVMGSNTFTDIGTSKGCRGEFVYCPVSPESLGEDLTFPADQIISQMVSSVSGEETITCEIISLDISDVKGSIFKANIANDQWDNSEVSVEGYSSNMLGRHIDLTLNNPELSDSNNYYRLFENGLICLYYDGKLNSKFAFRNIDCALLEYTMAQGHIEEWFMY